MLQGCSLLYKIQPSNKVTRHRDWLLQYIRGGCVVYTLLHSSRQTVQDSNSILFNFIKTRVVALPVGITLEGETTKYKLRRVLRRGRSSRSVGT